MSHEYDYIIVGAGPAGLTTAWLLGKQFKCLVIDSNDDIGGCHRVITSNEGYFGEHGPRVYSSAYLTFSNLLRDMGGSFDEFFTKYDFPISQIGRSGVSNFTWRELGVLVVEFLTSSNGHLRDISVDTFMTKHKFSDCAKDYSDRLCRLTDGAGSDRYSLYQFLQLVNQQMMYSLYQPKRPNNVGLFAFWKKKLLDAGIDIMLNTPIESVITCDGKVTGVRTSIKAFNCSKGVILAIPPRPLSILLTNSGFATTVLEFWSRCTEYLPYQNFTFSWNRDVLKGIPRVHGFPKSKWGVAHIILSDYFTTLPSMRSNQEITLISTCITKSDRADVANANESTKINEVFNQLRLSYDLPMYDNVTVEHTASNSAFIAAAGTQFIDNRFTNISNLYNVGTHNGHSHYAFTSLESAVSNAVYLADSLGIKSNLIEAPVTLCMLMMVIIIILCILVAMMLRMPTLIPVGQKMYKQS